LTHKRWSNWLSIVLIASGVILLLVGIVNLSPRSANAPQAGSTVQIPPPSALPSPSPTFPQPTPPLLNSSQPAAVAISPISTPTPSPPTSTPMLTLTSTLPVTPELGSSSALTFNGETAYQHVLAQVAYGPRPTGSEAGWATGDFILATLEQAGWTAETQEFIFMGVKGRNIIGKLGSGPLIIFGAHYDTRPAADHDPDPAKQGEWIEGANDGASGVAVLLELARVLEANKLKNEIWLAFFDAEDRGRLEGWPFSVGARHMAENLAASLKL